MPQRIIYQNNEGGVAVIIPSGELPIEEVARKDVPAGARFAIINTDDVPSDRTFRSAWEVEHSDLNDGIGIGQQAWFIEQFEAEIAAINAEVAPTAPDALVAARKEDAGFPEDFTPEETDAAYAELVAHVAELNAQAVAAHAEQVAAWEASKVARLAQLNQQIAVQQAEMQA